MMKKIRMLCIALIFIGLLGGSNVTLAAEKQVDINDDQVYKINSYRYGDCVLWANAYMLRRAAILNGSEDWAEITPKTMRRYACTSKNGSALRYAYTYEADGITYSVEHGYLSGSASKKMKKLKKLLKQHPEGVVVWGSSRTGVHGVLATHYEDGTLYAVDSTHNLGGKNYGVRKFSRSTMYGIGSCSHYWYLKAQSGTSVSRIEDAKIENLQVETTETGNFCLRWTVDDTKAPIDGYVIYYAPVDEYTDNGDYVVYAKTEEKELKIENLRDGKSYYFKVRGYYNDGGKRIYTRYTRKMISMDSAPQIGANVSAVKAAAEEERPVVAVANILQ